MTSLEAKFAREAKPRPKDWVIAYSRTRGFYLVFIGRTTP